MDYIHGSVFYDVIDFEYPGVIPIKWERSWNSGNTRPGALGYGSGSLYKANRLIRHIANDGNVTHLAYNAYDDVIQLKDNEQDITFTYTPLGEVAYRKEQNREIKMNQTTTTSSGGLISAL